MEDITRGFSGENDVGINTNVLAAFNSFDVRHNSRVKLFTNSSVDALGMSCTIRSFKNTTVFSNMVVYWVTAF
jgi:hypothetical protein